MTAKCEKCKDKTRVNLIRGKYLCYDCDRVTRPVGKPVIVKEVVNTIEKPKRRRIKV